MKTKLLGRLEDRKVDRRIDIFDLGTRGHTIDQTDGMVQF